MKRILKGINEISPSVLLLSRISWKKVEHQEKKGNMEFWFFPSIDYFQSLELLWIFADIIFTLFKKFNFTKRGSRFEVWNIQECFPILKKLVIVHSNLEPLFVKSFAVTKPIMA